ncbi:MAG: GspH/FimT family pseudopilin [Pseudomonadota bacterium]
MRIFHPSLVRSYKAESEPCRVSECCAWCTTASRDNGKVGGLSSIAAPPSIRRRVFNIGSHNGFSLVELMIVVTLAGLILVFGAPSFQASLERNRLQSGANTVASALSFARSEAVIRGAPVSICPTVDTTACSGSNWETGWLVFVDDGDGGGTPADGTQNGSERLLRIGEASPQRVTVRTVNFPTATSITFEDDGRILQDIRGTVTVCDDRGADEARGFVVQVSGQVRRAVDGDGDGVREDDSGTALACP